MRKLFQKLGFAAVIAAGLILGEAGARDEQTAQARVWQYYITNNSSFCEGCCNDPGLCCDLNQSCNGTPID